TSSGEAFLYDSVSTLFMMGTRHPDPAWREHLIRSGVRLGQFYMDNLGDDGGFLPKIRSLVEAGWPDTQRDPKYSYAEPCALSYFLTGDPRCVDKAKAAASCGEMWTFNSGVYSADGEKRVTQWTERHTGMLFNSLLWCWELTGDDHYLKRITNPSV